MIEITDKEGGKIVIRLRNIESISFFGETGTIHTDNGFQSIYVSKSEYNKVRDALLAMK